MKTHWLLLLFGLLSLCFVATCQNSKPVSQAESLLPTPVVSSYFVADPSIFLEIWGEETVVQLPRLRIWKNGRAVWVIAHPDRSEVREKYLSQDELAALFSLILNSGFATWQEHYDFGVGDNARDAFSISVYHEKITKRVTLEYEGGVRLKDLPVYQLRETLLTSLGEQGANFQPEIGFLKVWKGSPPTELTSREWLASSFGFDMQEAMQGKYIAGADLAHVWEVVKLGDPPIVSDEAVYYFSLKLPGLSCMPFKSMDAYLHALFCAT